MSLDKKLFTLVTKFLILFFSLNFKLLTNLTISHSIQNHNFHKNV